MATCTTIISGNSETRTCKRRLLVGVSDSAAAGTTVPELLRREAARLAARPTMDEWLARISRRSSLSTNAETLEALDEIRGPWPNARR